MGSPVTWAKRQTGANKVLAWGALGVGGLAGVGFGYHALFEGESVFRSAGTTIIETPMAIAEGGRDIVGGAGDEIGGTPSVDVSPGGVDFNVDTGAGDGSGSVVIPPENDLFPTNGEGTSTPGETAGEGAVAASGIFTVPVGETAYLSQMAADPNCGVPYDSNNGFEDALERAQVLNPGVRALDVVDPNEVLLTPGAYNC